MDPLAFTEGKEKKDAEKAAAEDVAVNELSTEGAVEEVKGKKMKGKGKRKEKDKGKSIQKGKRKQVIKPSLDEEGLKEDTVVEAQQAAMDPLLLNDGILVGIVEIPLFNSDPNDDLSNIDPVLLQVSIPMALSFTVTPTLTPPPTMLVEEAVSTFVAKEVSVFLQNKQGLAQISMVDKLLGLNKDKLDQFILTDDEVKIKEQVWVELNCDYLEALTARGDQQESGILTKSRKNLIKKNSKYSKCINYNTLKDLFVKGGGLLSFTAVMTTSNDNKDNNDLYIMGMGDKSNSNGMMVIVKEEPGTVATAPPKMVELWQKRPTLNDNNLDAEEPSKDEKDDSYGWDDGYEQEV
ncbi:hypothetical protein BDQ12DRAFT_668240 [Crucibulum laeve]|uniref:Brf1 TBP-binding domain-containing protein n=1 Tax=Crucibulum laeve TaxID=68775 RepID=A0A5C3LSW9_9AGAR|nr:hypothetical protein BDQ12DRAFT_668240 [Crucibulum laeve]